jgi:hypothetical protein
MTLRYTASKGLVEVEGSCASSSSKPAIDVGELSRTIIGAVVDEHELVAENGTRRFRLVKRGQL